MAHGVRVVADHLYGISYKPHELSEFGERVHFDVRWIPVADDLDASDTTHYRLCILEVAADVPAQPERNHPGGMLELLKIGYELELECDHAVSARELPDPPEHLRLALERIADTVNDLARRAGYQAPLGTDVIDDLLAASQQQQ